MSDDINRNQPTRSESAPHRILDRFLVNNPELEELSARLSTFNVFRVLRIEQAEIRHSNVLAWLFDPQESHGLGDAFLRRFLSMILLENETVLIDLTPAHVELMSMLDVEVWREWANIDLVAFSRSNKWVLCLENKVKAGASRRQLLKYIEVVKQEFSDFVIIPVLLTLEIDDGIEVAEEVGYIAWSYVRVYDLVNHIVAQRQDRIPEDAKVFLDHYLVILRRLTMQDEELVRLCKTIYSKHKDAIDLIVEWGATSRFQAAAESFISDNRNLVDLCLRHYMLWFIPQLWKEKMPACSDGWSFLSEPYPVACWFNFRAKSSKMGFIIEVGSMDDADKRLKLIEIFHKEGFKIGKKAFRPASKYTRVHSVYRKIAHPGDEESIRNVMDEIWKKSKHAVDSTSRIIENFDWE